MSFSAKQKSLAILPKISGTMSFLGSTYIFQDVARSKRRRSKPYNRLILALSTFDIMASVVNIMSTWPIPEGTPGVYAAVGTTGTCTAQGFFNETGNITTPMYNCMLCVYYILIIRNGWSETRVKKIEPYLHAVPLVVGWTMGIAGLPLTLYNPSGWLCWYAPYPGNCLNDPDVPCERGELAFVFRWVHYGIIWSAIFFVTAGMFSIYRKVQTNEAKTRRFRQHVHPDEKGAPRPARRLSFINRQENALKQQEEAAGRSRKVANQAMLFVGALYLTWLFTTVSPIKSISLALFVLLFFATSFYAPIFWHLQSHISELLSFILYFSAHSYLSNCPGKDILPPSRADGHLLSVAGVLQRYYLPQAKVPQAQVSEPKPFLLRHLLECAQDERQPWPRQHSVFCLGTRG